MDIIKCQKMPYIFSCKNCDFSCSKQSNYDKHLLTQKHLRYTTNQLILEKNAEQQLSCECGKKYINYSSLWRHKKKCNNVPIVNVHAPSVNVPSVNVPSVNAPMPIVDLSNNDIKMLTNLVLEVVRSNNELQKQNQELQKQVLDVCKNLKPVNISNNNNNNKTFNLQFFLNEECKDAMNLNDFVESVQLQMTDLEKIGELGYVDGVSNFILGKLNETDVNKRPVHCSDAKRETLYIKDDNVWTKEGEENLKIRGAVKKIEKKNIRLLNAWKETHTGCMDSESPYNDQYTHMIIGSLGGCEPDNVNKVIKKIAKATIIDK
jgi:hypothetical protein